MPNRTLRRNAEPENVKISFITDKPGAMNRDRSSLLNEAVADFLEVQQWHLADTRKAVEEAEAGDFATEREVERAFTRYKRDAR